MVNLSPNSIPHNPLPRKEMWVNFMFIYRQS